MKKATLFIITVICSFSLNAQIIYHSLEDTMDVNPLNPIEKYAFVPNDHSNPSKPLELKTELFSNGLLSVTLHSENFNSTAIGRQIGYGYAGTPFGGGALGTCYDIQDSSEWVSSSISNPLNPFIIYDFSIANAIQAPPTIDFDLYELGDRKYLGLKLASNDSIIHYGWVDLTIDSMKVIIHGWAYESIPNMPINAGSTSYSDTCVLASSILMSLGGGLPEIKEIGETLKISAEVVPANATDTTINWSVKNVTGNAKINSEGILTALQSGIVTVIAKTNDASHISESINVEISNTINRIDELEKETISIYPNPTKSVFTVQSDHDLERIIIYDLFGAIIEEINFSKSVSRIDLSKEKKGIYFLKIHTKLGVETRKITLN